MDAPKQLEILQLSAVSSSKTFTMTVAPPLSQSKTDHVQCAQPQQNDSKDLVSSNIEYWPPLNLCADSAWVTIISAIVDFQLT